MFTFTGILKIKNSEKQVSARFRKREFVLTEKTTSPFPQTVLFQLTQDRCPLLDTVNAGDEITVHFYIKGREWTSPQGETKFFNSLEVFKIEKINDTNETNRWVSTPSEQEQTTEPATISNEALIPTPDDDLPF